MSDVVVIEISSVGKVEEFRPKLLDWYESHPAELDDVIVVVNQLCGQIRLERLFPPGVVRTRHGGLWGLLPLMMDVAATLPLQGAAVFLLVPEATAVSLPADLERGAGWMRRPFSNRVGENVLEAACR